MSTCPSSLPPRGFIRTASWAHPSSLPTCIPNVLRLPVSTQPGSPVILLAQEGEGAACGRSDAVLSAQPSACYYLSSRLPLARLPQRPVQPPCSSAPLFLNYHWEPHSPACHFVRSCLAPLCLPIPQDLSPSTLGRGLVSSSGLPKAPTGSRASGLACAQPLVEAFSLSPCHLLRGPCAVNPVLGIKAGRDFKLSCDSPVTIWIGHLQKALDEYSERTINLAAFT